MDATPQTFWDDLAENLQDPEFREAYERETRRVAAVDQFNSPDDAPDQT